MKNLIRIIGNDGKEEDDDDDNFGSICSLKVCE